MVLLTILLIVLVGFVSLAVDVGRVRLAKTQLQNAADAAAFAAAVGLEQLPQQGVGVAQDGAVDAAAENTDIDVNASSGARKDSAVAIVPDEDIEFGIWRPDTRTFEPLESNGGGVDERREANAVRTWARRVTTYTDANGVTVRRNNGLKLMFAPIIPGGPFKGEIQAKAVAALTGGRTGYGFVGLEWMKFNGGTGTDSYNAATESYPGNDGAPNQLGSIASNGDITLVGNTTIQGDVHPGVDGHILDNPLGNNVTVTGYMNPLDKPLSYPLNAFSPSANVNPPTYGDIQPANALNKQTLAFQPKNINPCTIKTGQYLFSSWTTGAQDLVQLDNTAGPIEIWVNGDVKSTAQAGVKILGNVNPVTFHVNGDFKMDGGGIFNVAQTSPGLAKPELLYIDVTKAGTNVSIGGSPTMAAHIYAPGSDVKVNGNANGAFGYWGWIIGKSLFVTGGSQLHYDETRDSTPVSYGVHLVE